MTIKLYKLVTGDEVIGNEEQGSVTTLHITLTRPRILAIVMGPTGQPSIALRPFFVGSPAHETVTFSRGQVIGEAPVQEALQDAYLQQTSGLILGGRVS